MSRRKQFEGICHDILGRLLADIMISRVIGRWASTLRSSTVSANVNKFGRINLRPIRNVSAAYLTRRGPAGSSVLPEIVGEALSTE
jgi:hypothetical protein